MESGLKFEKAFLTKYEVHFFEKYISQAFLENYTYTNITNITNKTLK